LVFRAIDGIKTETTKRKSMKTLLSSTAAVLLFGQAAQSALILSDLQRLYHAPDGYPAPMVQNTQAGWTAQAAIRDTGSLTVGLTPTAAGLASGIGATMVSTVKWEARGGDGWPDERALVSGTSFDAVVSDLWFTRTMSFSIQFTGLTAGSNYRIRTWHNDSYTANEGFAAGGGIVTPSITGATVLSSANGTVTNRRGVQTDAAFGIADLQFIAIIANPVVTYTRTGGSINALGVNGVELTGPESAAVPEPGQVAASLVLLAGIGGYVFLKRRKAAKAPATA
jgi:hypothetical protein